MAAGLVRHIDDFQVDGTSRYTSRSAGGRVAFDPRSTHFVPKDADGASDIFVHDGPGT